MEINGITLNFKLTNAKVAERYESALKELQKEADQLEKKPLPGLAENIYAQIDLVHRFVDSIFGAGTYDSLGVDPDDLDENLDIATQITEYAKNQCKAIQRRNARYAPERSKR